MTLGGSPHRLSVHRKSFNGAAALEALANYPGMRNSMSFRGASFSIVKAKSEQPSPKPVAIPLPTFEPPTPKPKKSLPKPAQFLQNPNGSLLSSLVVLEKAPQENIPLPPSLAIVNSLSAADQNCNESLPSVRAPIQAAVPDSKMDPRLINSSQPPIPTLITGALEGRKLKSSIQRQCSEEVELNSDRNEATSSSSKQQQAIVTAVEEATVRCEISSSQKQTADATLTPTTNAKTTRKAKMSDRLALQKKIASRLEISRIPASSNEVVGAKDDESADATVRKTCVEACEARNCIVISQNVVQSLKEPVREETTLRLNVAKSKELGKDIQQKLKQLRNRRAEEMEELQDHTMKNPFEDEEMMELYRKYG